MSEICHRVGYYELVSRVNPIGLQKRVIKPLPFHVVQVPGMPGKLFEPADCMKRNDIAGAQFAIKEIHELKEYDPKQMVNYEETAPDGVRISLHGFGGWDWPA